LLLDLAFYQFLDNIPVLLDLAFYQFLDNIPKEQSKVQGDDRKEKGRLTKWERKGQSFERKSSLRF